MKPSTLPEFSKVEQALSQTSLKMHPSEAHGLMVGILCGQSKAKPAWMDLITGDETTAKTRTILQALYDVSTKQLAEFLFEFELLLPDDDEKLSLRAEGLTVWCQGFLTGLKLSNVQLLEREPGEMQEAINDLIEIAKMNYDEVAANEEDEVAYTELVEYVRMAVILIYQDTHNQKTEKSIAQSLGRLH